MFRFGTKTTLMRAARSAVPALALVVGVALAGEGHAAQFFLQSASMDGSRTGRITGPTMNVNVGMAPVKFTTFHGTGATAQTGATSGAFDMVGFCVDIFHSISMGTINLKYDDSYDLLTNSNYTTSTQWAGATALTRNQKLQVGRLVNYGTLIYNSAGPLTADKRDRMSAVQGAIWHVINPTYAVTSSNSNTTIRNAVNNYINLYSGVNYAANLTGYGRQVREADGPPELCLRHRPGAGYMVGDDPRLRPRGRHAAPLPPSVCDGQDHRLKRRLRPAWSACKPGGRLP
jgi:hypothetical protein